jgi:XTP/dITP diphosphohydrolase
MEILFASGNKHKKAEIAALFPRHRIILPGERGMEFDVDETGLSFHENAMLKVMALRGLWEGAILADDSGLCVKAMDGGPGIYSARYGSTDGRELDSVSRNALLLQAMHGKAERACAFACCMVLSLSRERFFMAQETMEGSLLESPRGSGGFGYDPIVWIQERACSVAELPEAEKNRLSHRGKAARALQAMVNGS